MTFSIFKSHFLQQTILHSELFEATLVQVSELDKL